ncbi:uncharacterized protein LOC133157996 isoform X6 [Syngnathus typhle]|uniref:uncharacterized protein LOC133157996 isoform X6 n=1 Tax=Syngnathus typhle TaxID=161592 RepID=UPI002A6AA1C3|nr:uncharacterized protein LOC133157996 isoform X6 [Syngnathus typhle]
MRTTLHLLLLLIPFGGYTGQPTFTTETKKVGQSVSLECPRNSSEIMALHIWIRLVSGSFPEILDDPEAETAVTAVTHDLQFNESRSQCSFVSRSGNKTCEDGHNFYWLRAGPQDSNPHFIYTHDECEKVAKGSMQECVHAFHNNVDTGTYSCAVATCGHIFMAKATKVNMQDPSKSDFLKTVIFVMAAALTLISILSAFLIYKVKTKTFCCCIACSSKQSKNPCDFQGPPTLNKEENARLNSTVVFSMVESNTLDAAQTKASLMTCAVRAKS